MRKFFAVLGLSLLAGCSQEEAVEVESSPTPETPLAAPEVTHATPSMDLDEAQLAILRAADLHDGAEDGVVQECGRCAFAMEGDESHAVHVGDYELHFCSDRCKLAFEDDLPKGLGDLEEFLAEDQ
jgi:hypothetical protein